MNEELKEKVIWQNLNSSKDKGKILEGKIIAIEVEKMKDKKNFFANGVKDARKAKEEIKRINEKRQKEGKEPLNEIQKRKENSVCNSRF